MLDKRVLAFHLFCIAILSSFLTLKIYPAVYLICMLYSLSLGLTKKNVLIALCLVPLFIYIVITYVFWTDKIEQADLVFFKFLFNSLFFLCICISECFYSNKVKSDINYIKIIEFYLRWALILSLLQMIILQIQSGGLRFDSTSSYDAGLMFNKYTIFWGVQDKNMAGAKIGLFGFLHAYTYYRLNGKVSLIYAALYIFCSALTLSRTSVILSALTFLALYFYSIKSIFRYIIFIPSLAVLLVMVFSDISSFIRLDSVKAGNADDGMAVRILYWKSFFNNLEHVSPFGNGLLGAIKFLGEFSPTGSANNMHNLYINNFLDLGILGSTFYLMMLFSIIIYVYKRNVIKNHCIVILFPIFLVTNTLYTAYDNDPWLYYSIILVISGLYISPSLRKNMRNN